MDDIITRGFFPPHYWQLLEQVADYYYTPLMQVIRVALPPGLLQRSQRRIRLNPEAITPGAEQFLSPIARRVLALLQNGKSDHYSATYVQQKIPGASRGIRDLVQRNYAQSYLETPRPAQPKLKQAVILIDVSPIVYTELTKRQKEVLIILRRHGGELWLTDLLQIARTTRPTISNLERCGCLVVEGREVLRRERGVSVAADGPKT